MITPHKRILVIDDDPGIREAYRKVFEQKKSDASSFRPEQEQARIYDLTLAATGEEGIQAAKEAVNLGEFFVLAFVDMMMPGYDGVETVERLWKIDPNIKTVIVSGHADYKSGELLDTAGKGEMYFFRKPFTLDEIWQLVENLMQE
jgi:CheY-like chemotaxis protein